VAVDRIVFVSVSSVLGGGELYLLRTAKAASARVDVAIAGSPATPILSAAQEHGLPAVELPLGEKLGFRTALTNLARFPVARRRLRRFLERTHPGEWTLLQYKWEELLWAGEVVPERVAIWEHGPIPSPVLRVPWARARVARAFRRAAAVFAWSAPARQAIAALSGRQPDMLAAGVDRDLARAARSQRQAVRARYGVQPGEPLLVFAGRLVEDKGVTDLVKSLPALRGARALICGDGPARARLEALVGRLHLEDRVHFVGFVADPLPYLAAGDATVLLSRSPGEGRPLVAVESQAVGTPVLGLAGPPALEHLAGEGLADLISHSDPATIRRGVELVLTRPRVPIEAPSWEEAAGRFLSVLQARDACN
jgi:glycosyltransferase involved in cell wall biosynthesis